MQDPDSNPGQNKKICIFYFPLNKFSAEQLLSISFMHKAQFFYFVQVNLIVMNIICEFPQTFVLIC